MLTKSAHNQVTETSQESGRRLSTSTGENSKKKDNVLEAKTAEKLILSSSKGVGIHSNTQNKLVPVGASETHVMINREESQKQEFHSPIFNIHIHVPPSNSENPSTPPTVQPIIHVHFDESNKNHDAERASSQKSLSERVVRNFLSMTSTDSRSISLDISDSSDVVNSVKENSYSPPNENGIRQRNDTDADMSDLSNISGSEISAEWDMKNVTQNKVPVIKLGSLKKQKSVKPLDCFTEDSNDTEPDKDFESVFPKLQSKLKNLIDKKIQKTNTCTYTKVKKKINYTKLKPLMHYQENDRIYVRQLRSSASKEVKQEANVIVANESYQIEPDKSDEPEVITIDQIQEVIIVSDSDTPTEKSNEEKVKSVKKVKKKKKSNRKSTKRRKKSDQNAVRSDATKIHKSDKKSTKSLKPERPKTRESIARKCKMPSKEQHLNWVKKVAFAKACQLQPNVFSEKELLVKSPGKPKKGQKTKKKSKTSLRSAKNQSSKRMQEDSSQVSYEAPRFSSYQHQNKRLSSDIIDLEANPKEPDSTNKRQDSKGRALESNNERNGEMCHGKKAQKLRIRSKTSLMLVNSDEESQEGDSLLQSIMFREEESLERLPVDSAKAQDLESRWEALLASGNENETRQNVSPVSCETSGTLSHGCTSTEKEVLGKPRVNSKKSQDLKSKWISAYESVNSTEDMEQNGSPGSCGTPEKVSYGCQSQATVIAEEEVAEKSPVDARKAQELKNKWVTAFASVDNNNRKVRQNGSLVSCETPKRLSSYQNVDRSSPKEVIDLESSPKAPSERQASKDEDSESENEGDDEICTLASTSLREENLEFNNNKTLTLLAEGCNFSEILQKFREKHYKDKVKVFFPNRSKTNDDDDNHIPQDSGCVAKESPLVEVELENSLEDVSDVQTVRRKKEKEKSDKVINDNQVDENSNPSCSLKEAVNHFSSLTEKPPQSTHPPQERESLNESNMSAIRVSVISYSNRIHFGNEKNLNCDGENVPGNKSFEDISDEIDIIESCCNSSLTGNGTTPEKNVILKEDNHEAHDYINEFRAIKKKLRSLPDNKLLKSDSEKNDDAQSSSTQLQSPRKELSNKCMAEDSDDIREIEITDCRLKLKRKGSPDPSSWDRSSPSVKKMKQSKETNVNSSKPKGSNKKVFNEDEYIPLDATGPTKFAVAPLDKVTPYREHAAKDFKGNMLYGNRVKRFSSPKSLEIYKAKQNASKKSSY